MEVTRNENTIHVRLKENSREGWVKHFATETEAINVADLLSCLNAAELREYVNTQLWSNHKFKRQIKNPAKTQKQWLDEIEEWKLKLNDAQRQLAQKHFINLGLQAQREHERRRRFEVFKIWVNEMDENRLILVPKETLEFLISMATIPDDDVNVDVESPDWDRQ